MPLFDFMCEACGKEIEEYIKMDEEPPHCPEDSKHGKMKKLLSKIHVRMGGGLYSWDKNEPDKFGDLD